MRLIALLIFTAAGLLSGAANAQDPPGRVGRIAFIEGAAAVYYDPDEGWERAYVNSPLTSENSVWTQPGSRAEMRVSGMAMRLDEATQLDIARLDDDELNAFVAQGTVAIRVRHFDNSARLDFATPHGRFRFFGTGRYRIDVDNDREETLLTVFTGAASLRSSSGDIKVEGGRAIRIYGGRDASFVRERAQSGAFDRWTLARDDKWIERRSTRYVSTNMTGYEELDTYGEWIEEPDFGPVWFPSRVARDWVPYRDGHWEHVRPWGWTWIGYEPWGYAPYHYGRWVYLRDRWGWYPGPTRVERPVWAPALVAWVGGANFSVSVGSTQAPALGWYPLSPWDRYDPWYRAPATYVNRVNVIVRDSPRDDRRRQWRESTRERGATIVRREEFGRERSVRQVAVPVRADVLQQAQVVNPTSVLPTREQVRRRGDARTGVAPVGPVTAPQPSPLQPAAPLQQASPPQAQPGQPQPRASSPMARDNRLMPPAQPNFQRGQVGPAPSAATQAPPRSERGAERGKGPPQVTPAPQAAPAPQLAPAPQVAPAPQATPAPNPFARGDYPGSRRPDQPQQQQQQQQQREQQQAQERAQREAQQQQQRQQREQQQAQERAQREAQQQEQRQQREAQQNQQRQQREAQQAQERARAAPPQAAPRSQPAPQPAPQAAPQAQPQSGQAASAKGVGPAPAPAAAPAPAPAPAPERGKGRDKERDRERDKGRDKERDDDQPGKGKGRDR